MAEKKGFSTLIFYSCNSSALMEVAPLIMYCLFFFQLNTGRVCTIFGEIILNEKVSIFPTHLKPKLSQNLDHSHLNLRGYYLGNCPSLLVRHLLSSLFFYLPLGSPQNRELLPTLNGLTLSLYMVLSRQGV